MTSLWCRPPVARLAGDPGQQSDERLRLLFDGSALVELVASTLYYLPSFNLWTVSLQGGRWRQNTFGEVSYLYPDVDQAGNVVSTAPVAIRYLAVSRGIRWNGKRSSRCAGDAANGTGADTDGGSGRQRGCLRV